MEEDKYKKIGKTIGKGKKTRTWSSDEDFDIEKTCQIKMSRIEN